MPSRVRVIGTSGAGKSRVARRLSSALRLPYVELDALHHRAGWQQAPDHEFRAEVAQATATAGWVADGNYQSRLGDVLADADIYVWLDYPRRVVTWRVVRRSLGRVVSRRELWNGNRERWRGLLSLDPQRNVVLWSWTTHGKNRDRYHRQSRTDAGTRWIRLRTPKQAEQWLRNVERTAAL